MSITGLDQNGSVSTGSEELVSAPVWVHVGSLGEVMTLTELN